MSRFLSVLFLVLTLVVVGHSVIVQYQTFLDRTVVRMVQNGVTP